MLAATGAVFVAVAARKAGALTTDGAAGAAVIGFVVFGWGGLGAAWPLLFFFVSASALTRLPHRRKTVRAEEDDTGGRRLGQVAANGVVPALALIGGTLWPGPWWHASFAGALAAVTADTWATEIGRFSRRPPVLITTGRPVPAGRSGAISFVGTVGGAAGAGCVAAIAAAAFVPSSAFVAAATIGGVVGLVADSVLGATVQARYRCPVCGTHAESRRVCCGVPAVRVGGLERVTNDTVNFATSFVGALVGGCLSALGLQ